MNDTRRDRCGSRNNNIVILVMNPGAEAGIPATPIQCSTLTKRKKTTIQRHFYFEVSTHINQPQ